MSRESRHKGMFKELLRGTKRREDKKGPESCYWIISKNVHGCLLKTSLNQQRARLNGNGWRLK